MKQKMTKFLLLMLALALCLGVTACGGDSESAESTKSAESSTLSPEDDPNEGLGGGDPVAEPVVDDAPLEVGLYEGIWISDPGDNLYDNIYIEFDGEGNWKLYSAGEVKDEGYIWYDLDSDSTFLTSYYTGALDGGQLQTGGDWLYIDTCGSFTYCAAEDGNYPGNENSSGYSWSTELCQRIVSEFEGTWYYDGDLASMMYIIIDENGNWSYYQRAIGDAEAERMDYGTFSYSTDEVSTYYADSAMYDGLSIRVWEFDERILNWGEDMYYRME